ncbi:immunity 49 family protein [Streptomyces sp. NPDC026659]|uniref:immunity 49 family protein n=1 Tax=Streptomyces sp. NPDC026659 TaxID=3155123 RepID=UPI00340EA87C
MDLRILRHDFPVDDAAKAMAPIVKSSEEVVSGIETSDFDRFDALGYSLVAAKWRCAIDPTVAELSTWEAWITAMQVGSALFISGASVDGPVACRVGDEVKHLPATGPQEYLHAGNWLTAYYLAAVCRENERLEQLARIPVSFLRASGVEFDEYIYSWVKTLQDAWFGRREMWDGLVSAINGTDPASPHIASAELMLKILYPPLELFHRYQRQEAGKFNAALAEALVWHKEYWSGDEARSRSGEGLVALGPLAIACMAYDANIPVDIESDYLPRHLLDRTWIGRINT